MSSQERINWYTLGDLDNIPVRGTRRVVVADKTIGIFRTSENSIYAIDDKCPHKNGPLSEGIVHGNCVTCPLHNWVIDLSSGEAQGADNGSVETYPVKVVDGQVLISLNTEESVVSINDAS